MKFGYYAISLRFCGRVLAGCVDKTGEEPIGNRTSTVHGSWTGGAFEGQLTFEGDNRSDGSLWQFRWNRNEDAYFMVGRLPWNEGVKIAASVGAETWDRRVPSIALPLSG